jgi:3-oxoacyl-[acyl-carrier protein] reductase
MGRLDGRIAIITGAGKGIGRATALRFAEEGATVVLAARSEAPGQGVLDEITAAGGKAVLDVVDVGHRETCRGLVERTAERFGGIDIILHNAAYTEGGRIDTVEDKFLRLTFDVGLMPCFWLTADALPWLKQSKFPRILVTSSVMGPKWVQPGRTHYATMKCGITGFVRSAAIELAAYGITVNAVEPGTTMTDSVDRLVSPEFLKTLIADIPLGRGIKGSEIANAFIYFASDDGAMTTGQTLAVDGGSSLGSDKFMAFDDH